ncbi:MAG TPA: HAD-IIIA family hydrolase [bacterium]|nr:HAD-IIIA family hydrolase [bacterium]
MAGARAVFCDRDGVLDALIYNPATGEHESPHRPEDLHLLPGAADALRQLAAAGWTLVTVSNQPSAAKGKVTRAGLDAVHARFTALLADAGVRLAASEYCHHHPAGVVPELTGPCSCRKPAPGMVTRAAAALGLDPAHSWLVGDTDADVQCGAAAGCRTILLAYPRSAHKRTGQCRPDRTAADFFAAAAIILVEGI